MLEESPNLLPTPPYVAFSTFWTFIQELKRQPTLPRAFDATAFGPTRSGATRSQLLIALRFFDFIDGEKKPTQDLRSIVVSPDAEHLQYFLNLKYSEVMVLNLRTATPVQLDTALLLMGASDAMLRKSRTFFIHAAMEAKIELGSQFAGVARSPRRRVVRRKTRPPMARTQTATTPSPARSQPEPLHPFIQGLLQELPTDGRWTKVQRDRWIDMARLAVDMLYEVELME